MIINAVGNYANGYVGETGDLTHLVREMRALGHVVREVPQDIWKAHVDGENDPSWLDKLPTNANINIICKWHHFDKSEYIDQLRAETGAPVFLWVWDYMWDQGIPSWHVAMATAADLYLGNDVHAPIYKEEKGINAYYFPFDVSDGDIKPFKLQEKVHDVVFFGSCIGQGDRIEWLTEINKTNPVKMFSWNYEEWQKRGFEAYPAVYGEDFAREVAKSKIILGFSVAPSCWGYWSNRVGKILTLGGFLLYQYAPGMELFLRDGVEYFSSIEEAREKIDHYLIAEDEREKIARIGYMIGQERFTSKARIKDLMILIERYLKTGGKQWQI